MNCLIRIISIAVVFATPVSAQKLVDPTTVAPEYREAAEHRRAEQMRQRECNLKADLAKVQMRDRTGFILKCLEADAGK